MNDPTYNKPDIDDNPVWKLAFLLSELDNDNAPIGWSEYIRVSQAITSYNPKAALLITEGERK